jgi:ribosome-associated protein
MKYGVTIVPIHTEYIKLDQFLKLSNIVQTGGEARFFILDNDVFVNGELETIRFL